MQNFKMLHSSDGRPGYKHYSGTEGNVIAVNLYHRKGKGIILSMRPVKLEKRKTGFSSESFMMFDERAGSIYVAVESRYNAKRLAAVAEKLDAYVGQMATDYAKATVGIIDEDDNDTSIKSLLATYLRGAKEIVSPTVAAVPVPVSASVPA
jgi:hypothetical protein